MTSRFRRRHVYIIFSFILIVIAPATLVTGYLYTKAKDQFVATIAFTVRSEDVSSAVDLLGGLSALGSGSSSDSDILFEYMQSKSLVSAIDNKLNLRAIFSEHYRTDPWFSFNPSGTIEDLVEYWPRMVKIFYDQGTGLIEVQVRAFSSDQSKIISDLIFSLSSKMINELSNIAREDAIANARVELQRAESKLKNARQEMTEFRSLNKMIDPMAELEMQTGVINALQAQLSELLVEYDLILSTSGIEDLRLAEISQRIDVVRSRISEEKNKFGDEQNGMVSYSKLMSNFEGLLVDREYAEKAYVAALAAYDSATVEAQRQSRYLAAYVQPTKAEKSEHPNRILLSTVCSFTCFLAWLILIMMYYGVKDRR